MSRQQRKIWMDPPGRVEPPSLPVKEYPWRIKVRHLRETPFDDNAKAVFLNSLQKHGKLSIACEEAGVLYTTYRSQRQQDEDFDHAIEHTLMVFKEGRVNRLEIAAMNGHKEPIFGPNGEVGERTRYESGLRAMVLKAYAPEMYGDKLAVEHSVASGVTVVPAILDDKTWEEQFIMQQGKFEALDVEGSPVPSTSSNEAAAAELSAHALLTEGEPIE